MQCVCVTGTWGGDMAMQVERRPQLGLPPPGCAPVPRSEGGLVFVRGCPDQLFDGLYAVDADAPEVHGKPHFSNSACHLFCNRAGEWCLKDCFNPASNAARAFSSWSADAPVDGESEWRWWASRWKTVTLTVATGAAAAVAAEASAAAVAAAAAALAQAGPQRNEVDWGAGLSKEIVMRLLHFSPKRTGQSMACVNRAWRDAAKERERRPSVVVVGAQTHIEWIQERRRMHPHSFG